MLLNLKQDNQNHEIVNVNFKKKAFTNVKAESNQDIFAKDRVVIDVADV